MTENAATAEITENPTGENGENVNAENQNAESAESTYVLPSIDEIDFGNPLLTNMSQETLTQINAIKEIDAILERQKSDFAETKLIDFAENSDDAELKSLFAQFNKQVERLEKVKADLITKVSEKIGGEKLTDEEIEAKKAERKTAVETAKLSVELLNKLIEQGTAGEHESAIKEFVSHLTIPGTRSTSTPTGTGASVPKPRLNNGSVTVKDQNHTNFPTAAKHLSSILNRDVTSVELVNAWTDSQNVGDWKDIPDGVSTFNFEGVEINVVKNPRKSK